MKKKLVALLLCLVMALSLIPTTVWAAQNTGHSIDVRFTVLYVGDEFNIGYNYGSSEKTTFVCQYSTPHSDTAYNNHTIAISDIKAAADRATVNEGYEIVGWTKVANSNPTIWGFNLKEPTACNKGTTIYLVAKNPNPAPVEPSAPSTTYVESLNGLVNVYCTTENTNKATSKLISGTYSIGNVTGSANSGYTCPVTITNVAPYVALATDHVNAGNHDTSITLSWNGSNWIATNNTATIYVKCETLPPAPSVDWENLTISKLADKTTVKPGDTITYTITVTNNTGKDLGSIIVSDVLDSNLTFVSATPAPAYDSTTGKWTISSLANGESTTLKITATVNSSVTHGETITNTATINAVDVGGDALEVFNDKSSSVTVTVNIPATPDAPDYDELKTRLAGKVNMVCETENNHSRTYGLLENTYNTSEVAKNANGVYTCTVTIINDSGVSEYIAKYNDDTNSKHEAGDTANDLTITLEYDKENSKWVVSATDNTAIIYVKCTSEQEAPEAPTAEDLENYKLVKVDCDTKISHGEKTYALLDGTFTTAVTVDKEGIFRCVITITQDGAKKYVEQYSKDLNKTHSLKDLTDKTITLKYEDNSWVVDEKDDSASILAKCSTGSNSNTNPSKPSDGKPVTSQKTFDAGIALYAGLSILSLTGGALVIRKRKEF